MRYYYDLCSTTRGPFSKECVKDDKLVVDWFKKNYKDDLEAVYDENMKPLYVKPGTKRFKTVSQRRHKAVFG